MFKKELSLFFIVMISTIFHCQAQNVRTVVVVGKVVDSFTGMAIPDAKVSLMAEDSTVLDTCRVMTLEAESGFPESIFAFPRVAATPARYILKVEHEGYEVAYIDYDLKHVGRNTRLDLPPITMKKLLSRERTLGEVTVTATKVKVVHRGDTLVFNADAFNVAEGSMLDGLIRQMPGVELRRNGEIFVNGKKIDYMLLNGKDFYRGNNRLMLENLPYYMVQNVKVYHRTTDRAQYAGLDGEKMNFVMDVNMKRQYRQGYMANVEAGGGTDQTWIGRVFGLRFTDHSRLSLIGNANNVNAEYNIDNQGRDSDDGGNRDGRDTRKTVSTGLQIDSRKWANNIEATTGWHKKVTQQKSYSETLHSNDSSTYSSDIVDTRSDVFLVSAKNDFTLKVPFYMKSVTEFSYDNSNSTSCSDYTSSPSSQLFQSKTDGHSLSLAQSLSSTHKLAWGDVIDLNLSFRYNDGRDQNNEDRNIYIGKDNSLIHIAAGQKRHTYRYQGGVAYSLKDFHHGTWHLVFSYSQQYKNDTEQRTNKETGIIDYGNSHSLGQMQRTWRGEFSYFYDRWSDDGGGHTSFQMSLPLRRLERRSLYCQASLDTCAMQRAWWVEPSAEWEKAWNGYDFMLRASYTKEMPEVERLVTVPNTIDPLKTYTGNPNLKNPGTLSLRLMFFSEHALNTFRLFASWQRYYKQITQGYTYDAVTGHYTFMPQNVDGNWKGGYRVEYNRKISKGVPLWIGGVNKADFGRTKNLTWSTDNAVEATKLSFLDMEQNAHVAFDKNGLRLVLNGAVEWHRTTSPSDGFTSVNAYDYRYGLQAICRLPWEISLDTEISMTHHRGYDTPSLNTNNCTWNMTVGRSFFKGKRLTVRLTGFDIFRDYSALSEVVSSSGRTEAWRRSLPAYWMLRVGYKFNVNPKNEYYP